MTKSGICSSILFLLICGGLGQAQPNLVKNPGFESAPATQGLPGEGWWLYEGRGQPEVRVDSKISHSGRASVRLRAREKAKFTLVSPRVEVSPGDELRFEARVRAEKLPRGAKGGYVGLAFRDATGRVFDRAYFQPDAISGDWTRVSGTVKAPANATSAEVHLGYTNAPGALWFDDVSVVITSPLSLSLADDAQPWPGEQQVTVRVINRQTNPFRGTIRAVADRKTNDVPVQLEPGTSQLIKVRVALTGVGLHKYKLSLLDSIGNRLRNLEGTWRTTAPLMLFPACPCYHPVGAGAGDMRVDARIVMNPKQRNGLCLAVELKDATGKTLQTETTDASEGDIVGLNLSVPVGAPGVFDVTARLLDRGGRELAKADTDIHVGPRDASQVKVGTDGFLRIGGKTHFPIGLYSCGRFDEMARAGFSGTHNYGITTGEATEAINPNEARLKQLLDNSWANGMRMMVELPRNAIEKVQWAQVRRRIETFRHHPGLLCWGSEERVARGEAPLANIAALYRLVRELDPDHPLVLGDTRAVIGKLQEDRRNFFPDDCMDVGIWWWYPIPLHTPDGNGLEEDRKTGLLEPPSWLTTTLSKKPLWIAIQSYQKPSKDARFPTPAEYRALAYLSIINGVKGLWFYTGSGQRDWQGKPAGVLNQPVEARWDYVQQLVRELRELEPVIMAKSVMSQISLSPLDAPVEFTVRELDGRLHLLAANKSDREQTVRFHGSVLVGKQAEVLHERHTALIEREVLADRLGPFGVRVYRIE